MSAPVVIAKQNRLMRRYRQAGATAPESACVPEDIGCRDSWVFRRMVFRGVFVEAKPGQFYIDEIAAGEFVRLRRARMLWWLAIVLGLCGLVMLASRLM
jgi:hypothetical protein